MRQPKKGAWARHRAALEDSAAPLVAAASGFTGVLLRGVARAARVASRAAAPGGVGMRAAILSALLAGPSWAVTQPGALVEAARRQVGVTVQYDGAYRRMPYPGGDVPLHTGVCTDVVVRAYRQLGIDLQQLVHEDMKAAWSAYPHSWGLKRPDPNIDHRRVPNLQVFFTRRGAALPPSRDSTHYQPGDLVTWRLPGNLPHIGIVSSRSVDGRPLVLHNIGQGTREDDLLFAYPITGHYRWLPAGAGAAARR